VALFRLAYTIGDRPTETTQQHIPHRSAPEIYI